MTVVVRLQALIPRGRIPLYSTKPSINAYVKKTLSISLQVLISSIAAMNFFPTVVSLVALMASASLQTVSAWTVAGTVSAWTVAGPVSDRTTRARITKTETSTRLYHAPEKAPRHDVGGDPFASLTPDQKDRVQAYMQHQQSVPKPGFPTDVRSLVQYNHGFAVMSTNSKS